MNMEESSTEDIGVGIQAIMDLIDIKIAKEMLRIQPLLQAIVSTQAIIEQRLTDLERKIKHEIH